MTSILSVLFDIHNLLQSGFKSGRWKREIDEGEGSKRGGTERTREREREREIEK